MTRGEVANDDIFAAFSHSMLQPGSVIPATVYATARMLA
jgi:hypothetical protein